MIEGGGGCWSLVGRRDDEHNFERCYLEFLFDQYDQYLWVLMHL
jgi:hypothetical protein